MAPAHPSQLILLRKLACTRDRVVSGLAEQRRHRLVRVRVKIRVRVRVRVRARDRASDRAGVAATALELAGDTAAIP